MILLARIERTDLPPSRSILSVTVVRQRTTRSLDHSEIPNRVLVFRQDRNLYGDLGFTESPFRSEELRYVGVCPSVAGPPVDRLSSLNVTEI